MSLPVGGGTGVKKSAQRLPRPESTPTSWNPPWTGQPWKAAPGLQPALPRLPRYKLFDALGEVDARLAPSKGELHAITRITAIDKHRQRAIMDLIHRQRLSRSRWVGSFVEVESHVHVAGRGKVNRAHGSTNALGDSASIWLGNVARYIQDQMGHDVSLWH